MRWLVGGLVLVGLVMAGTFGLLRSGSGTSTSEDGSVVLHFGDLAIPVVDEEPLSGSPPIFVGTMVNPEPRFDPSALGEDLTLVMSEPDRDVLDRMTQEQNLLGWFGRVVYVGDDVSGAPVYLFQQTGPSIIDLIKGVFTDTQTSGIFGSTYDCCRSQQHPDSAPVRNQPTLGFIDIEGQTYAFAEMWSIQEDVAVIGFTDGNSRPLGWQRPVSRYVGARFDSPTASGRFPDVRMVAYNANGEIIQEASWTP